MSNTGSAVSDREHELAVPLLPAIVADEREDDVLGLQIAPDVSITIQSTAEPEFEGPKPKIDIDKNEGESLGIDYA